MPHPHLKKYNFRHFIDHIIVNKVRRFRRKISVRRIVSLSLDDVKEKIVCHPICQYPVI